MGGDDPRRPCGRAVDDGKAVRAMGRAKKKVRQLLHGALRALRAARHAVRSTVRLLPHTQPQHPGKNIDHFNHYDLILIITQHISYHNTLVIITH